MHGGRPFYGFVGCRDFKDFIAEKIDAQREQCPAVVIVVHYKYFLFPISHNTGGRIRDANLGKQILGILGIDGIVPSDDEIIAINADPLAD